MFNTCSGLNRQARGQIFLDDRDISRWSTAERARSGIGRTFQRMELCDSLSVRENVALGYEAFLAGRNPYRHFISRFGDRKRVLRATGEALTLCNIAYLADKTAGGLSTGQRRLVEIARAVAGPSQILLLDEPSSGLDRSETEQFAQILRKVVKDKKVGILLVEHDMALVSRVCDRIYVLDFGRMIFSGTPEEAFAAPIVRAAYLGNLDIELAEDGHTAMHGAGSLGSEPDSVLS